MTTLSYAASALDGALSVTGTVEGDELHLVRTYRWRFRGEPTEQVQHKYLSTVFRLLHVTSAAVRPTALRLLLSTFHVHSGRSRARSACLREDLASRRDVTAVARR
jgi:hypothetical protein